MRRSSGCDDHTYLAMSNPTPLKVWRETIAIAMTQFAQA